MTVIPLTLKANSIGRTAADRIAGEGEIGRLHSIFSSVVNVVTPDEHLISLVNRRVGKGPINIVTDMPEPLDLTSVGLRRGDSTWKADGSLVVGNRTFVISLKGASVYSIRRHFGRSLLPIREMQTNLTVASRRACQHGRTEGTGQLMEHLLASLPRSIGERKLGPFARAALPQLTDLVLAIRDRDYLRIRDSAANLVGLGPGLTPSADDTLAGLMTSLKLIAENQMSDGSHIARVIEEITSCVPGRTTLLSEEYLMHAALGEANEPVVNLIQQIMTAGPHKAWEATGGLLEVGETSGTDIVLGILLGFELTLDDQYGLGADS